MVTFLFLLSTFAIKTIMFAFIFSNINVQNQALKKKSLFSFSNKSMYVSLNSTWYLLNTIFAVLQKTYFDICNIKSFHVFKKSVHTIYSIFIL